ncbi:hypothetical protein Csa_023588, partial [Cucumis sativus]
IVERGGDGRGGDKKRLMMNKAICNLSIYIDFPSLGKTEVPNINQDKKSLRIYSQKSKKKNQGTKAYEGFYREL